MPEFITPQGVPLCYDIEGEGPSLVFFHGWGVNRRIFRQQTKYFSETYRVLSVDLPGHGRSGWQPMTLEDMAAGMTALLDKEGMSTAGCVASSFGGLLALKIFDTRPERFRLIILVGAQAKFSRSDDYPYGLDVSRIRTLGGQIEDHYPEMVNIFFRSLFTRDERMSRRFRWIQTFRKTDDIPRQDALLGLLDILETEDLRHVLPRLSLPVQFINGVDDPICGRDLYDPLKQQLPHARFDWFERSGHFPFLSRPHEFNAVMETFLEDNREALCS